MDSTELLKKLRSAIANQPEEVPADWKTAVQWSDEWNVSANAAGIILNRSMKAGLMECQKFRIPSGGRGVYPVQHYRPKNP